MGYDSEPVMKLTEENKRLQWLFMFFTWFKCCELNHVHKSLGVTSLIKFMVDMGWEKKRAMQEILNFFKDQGYDENELIDIWNLIMEK